MAWRDQKIGNIEQKIAPSMSSFLSGMMKKQAQSAKPITDEEQLKQMQELGQLTKHSKRAVKKVVKNKATIRTLLDSITARPRFAKMVEYSIECLKNLAIDEVSVEEIVDEGALEVIKNILKLNPYNEAIQRIANKCLQQMCVNERMTKVIADAFGTAPLLHSLQKHVDVDTLIGTCKTVTALMKDKAVVDRFVNDGLIEAMASMIKANPDSPAVIAAASEALARVAEDPQHAKRIMDSGVMETVLRSLKMNPGDGQLAKSVIQLVATMSHSSPEVLDALKKMGVVDILVPALEAHPDNKELLQWGAQALSVLTGQEDVGIALKNIEMGNTQQDRATAIATVSSLALVESNVDYLVETGGIQAIVKALNYAREQKSLDESVLAVIESGCRGLARLAVNESNIYNIMKEGGVKMMISLLKEFPTNEKVVASALNSLAKCATRKENCDYLAKIGAVQLALGAVKAHPNSERVALHAIELLAALCAHPELLEAVIAAGGVEALLDIMKNHQNNPAILKAALNCLALMASSEEYLRRMRELGGFETVIDALTKHPNDVELAQAAILVLEAAAMVPSFVETLRKMGALDAILKVMEGHPDDSILQQLGARTLGLFASTEQVRAVLGNVDSLVDKLRTSTGSDILARGVIAKLNPALELLSNLALVDGNLGILQECNAVELLRRCFEIGRQLPKSDERDQLLISTVKTLLRLSGLGTNDEFLVHENVLANILTSTIANPHLEGLAESALALAEKLCVNPKLVEALINQGTISKVIDIAEAHALSIPILSSAATVLGYLAITEKAVRETLLKKGENLLVESVLNHMENPHALRAAVGALANLCIDEASVQALISAGALDALHEAMRTHPHDADVQLACMRCLGRMALTEEFAREIGKKGFLQLVTDAIRNHHSNEEVVQIGMVLLDSLGMVAENGRILAQELGGEELLQWAAQSFPDNGLIVQSSQRAMASLVAAMEALNMVVVPEATDIDASMVFAALQSSSLGDDDMLSNLRKVNAMFTMKDSDAAKQFVKKGGLDVLGQVFLQQEMSDEGLKAFALSFRTLAENASSMLEETPIASMELPQLTEALMKILKPTAEFASVLSADEIIAACQLLGDLAGKEANIGLMINSGAIQHLVQLLANDDPRVLEAVARVLAKMSNFEAAALLFAQGQNIKELIKYMRKHMDKPEFLKFAVYLLGNIAVNDDIKRTIGSLGGIQLIIEIMDTYPQLKDLIENCNFALANLSFNNEMNSSLIVACNGVYHIIMSMSNHPTAEDLLDSAMCALSNLCFGSDTNKELIVKHGGAKAIVDASLANFNNSNLLITAFRALGNLAFFPPNVGIVIREGGVQSIVAGLTVHATNVDLIQIAMGVLTNLASDLDAENMAIMAQEGAVQAIVEVVNNYVSNVEVEISALGCLCNLAREEYNSIMIVKQGGILSITKVINELNFDSELLEKSMRIISILTDTKINVQRILNDNGGQVICRVLNSERNQTVQVDGLRALYNLAYASEYANVLGQQGAIQTVLSCFQTNMNNANLVMEALRTLGSLCRSENNADAMALASMQALETALQVHYRDSKLAGFAMAYLTNLCVFPTATEQIIHTQLITQILQNMKTHLDTAHVVHRSLRAIENMALASEKVKDFMKRKGVVETLRELRGLTSSNDIKTDIDVVIDAILRVKKTDKSVPKSAKSLFAEDEETEEELKVEIEESVRNFLVAGGLLLKHSNTAKPRPRHVFVSNDLKWLYWKDPEKKIDDETPRMKVSKIRSVETGRFTPQLKRTNLLGKFYAKEECSFAILGRDRSIDLEATTEADRDKWTKMLSKWVSWYKAAKKAQTRF